MKINNKLIGILILIIIGTACAMDYFNFKEALPDWINVGSVIPDINKYFFHPIFGHVECTDVAEYSKDYQFTDPVNEWTTKDCGGDPYSQFCDFKVRVDKTGLACFFSGNIYICNDSAKDAEECREVLTGITFDCGQEYNIGTLDYNQKLMVYMNNDQWHILKRGRSYGLRVVDGNGFLQKEFQGCDISQIGDHNSVANSIDEMYFKLDKCAGDGCIGDNYQSTLPFDMYYNYIAGLTREYDMSLIRTYKGKDIYCVGAGYYSEIKLSQDGIKYTGPEIYDNNIECCPRNDAICGLDFKFKDVIVPSECPCPLGWLPSQDTSNKVVRYECRNDECIVVETKIIRECPTGYVLNANYDCVLSGTAGDPCPPGQHIDQNICVEDTEFPVFPIFIVIIIILLLILLYLNQNKKNKKRKLK